METADVVVVGAGANGTSTAFHLAKAGAGRVIVVERSHIAAGATGKSGALVRMHYTNEPETHLAVESLRYFSNWAEMVGGDCGFQQVGLLVFTPPEYRRHLEANVVMQRAVGANAHVITPEQAQELDPAVYVDDVVAVAYEPDSGFADPNATAFSFARAATAMGVRFELETEVTGVATTGGRVTGVETSRGRIAAPVVVVAAGAWANQLFQPLGIELGLVPWEARVAVFSWSFERSPRYLTYIDHVNGSWARPIDGTCTLVGAESGVRARRDPADHPETVTEQFVAHCRAQLARRFPVMRHSTMRGNWAGVVMGSPDARPVIDHLPHHEGLFCIAGDSGTSFKTSPAIGSCLAEWITEGRATTVDLTPFRSTRFAEGRPWVDEHDYGLERATISR
jgi:sarcosine oxidase, subunit beta